MPILPDSGEFLPEAPNAFNGYVWPAQGVCFETSKGMAGAGGRMHRGIRYGGGPVGDPNHGQRAGLGVVDFASGLENRAVYGNPGRTIRHCGTAA